jgi:plastocyanin
MDVANARRGGRWSGATVRRLALMLLSAVVALWAVNACSSSKAAPSAPTGSTSISAVASGAAGSPSSAPVTIHIHDFHYTVAASVPAGAKVEVMNMDGEAHTVTADADGFDVQVPAGQLMTFTAPSMPGRYPFHCAYHSNMHGTLIVT